MYCSNGLKRRWIWQEMKQIRLAFCFAGWRLAALFPFDWSIKSALPLSKPGPITESNFESQAVCPALCAARNSLSTLPKSGRGRRRVGNISSRFLLRDPLIVASCPLTLWPPLTSGHHVTSRANWSLSQPGERRGQTKQKQCSTRWFSLDVVSETCHDGIRYSKDTFRYWHCVINIYYSVYMFYIFVLFYCFLLC